jgi:hypothetical protein
MLEYVEIVDRDGRRRRARKGDVLQDGEQFSFHVTMLDAARRNAAGGSSFADGSGDASRTGDGVTRVVDALGGVAGHRPGFLFAADSGALSQKANAAYEQRKLDVAARWRKNRRRKKLAPQPQPGAWGKGGTHPIKPASDDGSFDDEDDFDSAELAALTLDELKLRAERARADRDQRLANGPWRNNR